jgi:hypothetical protein
LFVGSEEPLQLNQSRVKKKRKRRGRKKKQPLAPSLPPSRAPSPSRSAGGANENAALYEDPSPNPDGDGDVDVDVDVDAGEGVWPGEYGYAPAQEQVVPPPTSGVVAFPPEELERAIGVAFAASTGMQYWQVVDV